MLHVIAAKAILDAIVAGYAAGHHQGATCLLFVGFVIADLGSMALVGPR